MAHPEGSRQGDDKSATHSKYWLSEGTYCAAVDLDSRYSQAIDEARVLLS
jgi:hypothetical protein